MLIKSVIVRNPSWKMLTTARRRMPEGWLVSNLCSHEANIISPPFTREVIHRLGQRDRVGERSERSGPAAIRLHNHLLPPLSVAAVARRIS